MGSTSISLASSSSLSRHSSLTLGVAHKAITRELFEGHPSNLRVVGPRAPHLAEQTVARHIRRFHPRRRRTRGETVLPMPTRRRFKQRKGRPPLLARLFSSNAIPYASVTLPADAPFVVVVGISLSLYLSIYLSIFPFPSNVPSYFSSSSELPSFAIPPTAPLLDDSPLCRYFPID